MRLLRGIAALLLLASFACAQQTNQGTSGGGSNQSNGADAGGGANQNNFTVVSGGAASLIPGAVMTWDFHEQSGVIAHNIQNGTVYSTPNVLNLPERGFNLGVQWHKNNGPLGITDNFALGPDGINTNATRYQSNVAGTSFITYGTGLSFAIPSGKQVTASVWVKSNTGLAQAFQINLQNGGQSADLPITTSWTRVSFTGSTTGNCGYIFLKGNTAATQQDYLLYGLQVEVASSASTFKSPTLDLLFGAGVGATGDIAVPTWTGNSTITATGTQGGFAASDTDLNLSQMSIYIGFKSSTATLLPYGSLLTTPPASSLPTFDVQTSYWNAQVQGDGSKNSWPYLQFGGLNRVFPSGNCWDQAWHVIAGIGDGTTLHVYLDGIPLDDPSVAAIGTPAAISASLLSLGMESAASTGNNFLGQYGYVTLYNSAHTYAQVQNNTSAIAAIMVAHGLSISTSKRGLIVFEGDSITDGQLSGVGGHPFLVAQHYGRSWVNFGASGAQVASLNTRAAQLDALIDKGRPFNILVVNIGRNDLDNVNVATYIANLKAYWAARAAAGWTVIATTLLPTTGPTAGPLIASANTSIRANWATSGVAALADWGADATILANFASPTYLYDGTHPTNLTYTIMAPYVETAIDGLHLGA